MQEVVCIHVGQAGIQTSNASWELFCMEHGVEANGLLKESLKEDDSQAFRTFFNEAPNGQYVPRALSVDLEPSVLDEVRTGSYRNLFHPDQLVNIFDDGCNNFARAHFSVGKSFINIPMDTIRRITECCDGLQGFFLIHSHGGGTGSGFTTLVLDSLSIEYTKSLRFQFSIFPSAVFSSSVVEPYNTILSSKSDIDQSDITSLINNEAVFDICRNMLSISRPTFSNINRVISHGFSDMTVSLRFESTLSANFSQLGTNLIPYPRIHFPTMSYAPLVSENKADHEKMTTGDITRSVFTSSNQLITCNINNGLYMCCVLQYRGNVTPKDVNAVIFEIKKRQDIRFVDWCPTGFKLGINSQPSVTVPGSEMGQSSRSITMIANTTSIKDPIESIMNKFDQLLKKRSFVHWFVGEGMEEGEFNEARDEAANLICDFVELATCEDEELVEETKETQDASILPEKHSSEIKEDIQEEEKEDSMDIDIEDIPIKKLSSENTVPSKGSELNKSEDDDDNSPIDSDDF